MSAERGAAYGMSGSCAHTMGEIGSAAESTNGSQAIRVIKHFINRDPYGNFLETFFVFLAYSLRKCASGQNSG